MTEKDYDKFIISLRNYYVVRNNREHQVRSTPEQNNVLVFDQPIVRTHVPERKIMDRPSTSRGHLHSANDVRRPRQPPSSIISQRRQNMVPLNAVLNNLMQRALQDLPHNNQHGIVFGMMQPPAQFENVITPLKESEFSNITELNYKEYAKTKEASNEKETCSICYAEYTDEDKVKILPCSHVFHTTCIAEWFAENHNCPMCREASGEHDRVAGNAIL